MRDAVERFVRSLAEREADPESHADLGAFVSWLLGRRGYAIELAAWKHDGSRRVVSSGRRQWGVDLIASKPDADGTDRTYLFVLKRGSIGAAQWQPHVPGSIAHDLTLAAGLPKTMWSSHLLEPTGSDRVTIVAVHNGDLDTEDLGQIVRAFRDRIERAEGVTTLWWDARQLVAEALAPSAPGEVTAPLDPGLFAPASRPWARLALDSLRRDPVGSSFDLAAVDAFVDATLPLGRQNPTRPGEEMSPGEPIDGLRLARGAAVLGLFAAMVEQEALAHARGSVLPAMDAAERVCCRILEHFGRVEGGVHRATVGESLRGLVDRYTNRAIELAGRLAPIADVPMGLALGGVSETLDYPLRALRICGYLAVGAHLAADCERSEDARKLSDLLHRLWKANPGGVATPVTDDQVIEISAIWSVWHRLGELSRLGPAAGEVVIRLAVRRRYRLPGPAVWQWARVPMNESDLRVLVEVFAGGRDDSTGFTDEGSTLLPFAIAVAIENGHPFASAWIRYFLPDEQPGATRAPSPGMVPQVWIPPLDAARQWYAGPVATRGLVRVLELGDDAAPLVTAFREARRSNVPASTASAEGLAGLDWMAWKLWRTLPPLAELIGAGEGGGGPSRTRRHDRKGASPRAKRTVHRSASRDADEHPSRHVTNCLPRKRRGWFDERPSPQRTGKSTRYVARDRA